MVDINTARRRFGLRSRSIQPEEPAQPSTGKSSEEASARKTPTSGLVARCSFFAVRARIYVHVR